MHEALCRSSGTTLDSVYAEDGPPITQWTSGLTVRVSDAGGARTVDPGQGLGPASESHRRTNPRDGDEGWAVYGDLVARRRWRKIILDGLVRAGIRR